MIQEIFIEGEAVKYSIQEKHVISVLGQVYIYKVPTFEDLLHIVFLGLSDQKGLRFEEFRNMYHTGVVYTSRRKGQYGLFEVRRLVRARIKEINLRTRAGRFRKM